MRVRSAIILVILFMASAAYGQGKPSDSNKPAPQQGSGQPSQPAQAGATVVTQPSIVSGGTSSVNSVHAAIQERVKELIKQINLEPNMLMINPKAQVVKDQNWQPVTPDGKYNQDYKVTPDDSAPEIAQAVNVDQNRMKYTQELISLGLDAVPELIKASLEPANKYRSYLIYALGQIKDIHATPVVLKFYWDAVEKEKVAKSMEAMGSKDEAAQMRKETAADKQTSIDALKSLSGQDFGDNYPKWEAWWKDTEKKIGKVELPVLYDAKGAKAKDIAPSQTSTPGPAQPK